VYQKQIRDVDDLKQRLIELWSDAVSNHRRRVRASDTPTPEKIPKFCSQLGLGRGR